jgi:hypothetical protein
MGPIRRTAASPEEPSGPQGGAGSKRRNTAGGTRSGSGQYDALADREDEIARRHEILALPGEFQAEQACRHHKAGAVDCPENLLEIWLITSARIFLGEQLLPTTAPLPFFAYPFLVLTFIGWIWSLLRETA